ncbi:hypothetical protein AJ80_00248 [Polytolypa hystricis UAMH7299]|uniref:Uncharacterized protein n=1 Tax=Polytolypa hystricis (strain UAMH7299) TaxID=1447883 RepID=A0A2B7Z430_POLH7|nr:hypothetical protein AJ80_00248 [Polytolypa hystricis UAMH7299]
MEDPKFAICSDELFKGLKISLESRLLEANNRKIRSDVQRQYKYHPRHFISKTAARPQSSQSSARSPDRFKLPSQRIVTGAALPRFVLEVADRVR